jgi:hypothetical protein
MSSNDIRAPFVRIDQCVKRGQRDVRRIRLTACRLLCGQADFLLFGRRLSRALGGLAVLAAAMSPPPLVAAEATGHGLAKASGARLLVVCEAAQAQLDGKVLSAEAAADAALCNGFLEGFAWGHGWAAWRKGEDMYFCPPEKFSHRDALPALLRYLAAYPERLEADAHILVFSALSAAFPCATEPLVSPVR